MDHLKFNCFDLAEQNNEIIHSGSELQRLFDSLIEALYHLDPQIKSYHSLENDIAAALSATAGISARILTHTRSLDQIIDTYYKAEHLILRAVRELPTAVDPAPGGIRMAGRSAASQISVSTAAISNSDLILEDWLAELVHNNGLAEQE